jgi:hypothetical protein
MQKFAPKTIKLHPKFLLVFARSHSIGPPQNNFENYSPKKSASLWSTFIGYEDSSLGKNYGMKCSTIGNILRNT